MKADVGVFDLATVADKADFEHPHQYAVGFQYVLVNGKPCRRWRMTARRRARALQSARVTGSPQ
jgi:hypothetical protein